MKREDAVWLRARIEGLVKSPRDANFSVLNTGRCELEIAMWAAKDDRQIFTPELMAKLTAELKERTGIQSLAIYLDGLMPKSVTSGAYAT